VHDPNSRGAAGRAALSRRTALRQLGGGGIGAGLLAGLTQEAAGAQFSLSAASIEAAARRAIAAINQVLASGDPAALDPLFAADYVNHTPRSSLTTGQPYTPDLAGLKASQLDLRTLAPDAVVLIRDIVASPDKASILVTFRGTLDLNAVALPGLTNPRVRVDGVIFAHFAEGRVAESWEYDDAAARIGTVTGPVTVTPTPVPPTEVPVAEGMARETRDVRDFHAVSLEGIGTLLLQQGDTESLTVEAEARIIDRIETVVENGTLMIRPARSIKTREPVTYQLTARQIDGIAVAGTGSVQAGPLAAGQLQMQIGGTSSVRIDNLTGQALDVRMAGSGQVALAGAVDTQTVEMSGTGTYDATNLASRVATVTVQGTGQAVVNVSESLNAVVGGTGRVSYIGNPQVSQNVSGIGSVTKVG
jgi:hypothetical protein